MQIAPLVRYYLSAVHTFKVGGIFCSPVICHSFHSTALQSDFIRYFASDRLLIICTDIFKLCLSTWKFQATEFSPIQWKAEILRFISLLECVRDHRENLWDHRVVDESKKFSCITCVSANRVSDSTACILETLTNYLTYSPFAEPNQSAVWKDASKLVLASTRTSKRTINLKPIHFFVLMLKIADVFRNVLEIDKYSAKIVSASSKSNK